MKEIHSMLYPRTIPEVRDLIQDPNIHLDCTGCDNCRPNNIVPCVKGMEGMAEIGIGVVCMEKKVQITGSRIDNQSGELPVSPEITLVQNELTLLPVAGEKLVAD